MPVLWRYNIHAYAVKSFQEREKYRWISLQPSPLPCFPYLPQTRVQFLLEGTCPIQERDLSGWHWKISPMRAFLLLEWMPVHVAPLGSHSSQALLLHSPWELVWGSHEEPSLLYSSWSPGALCGGGEGEGLSGVAGKDFHAFPSLWERGWSSETWRAAWQYPLPIPGSSMAVPPAYSAL